jgi:phosphoribosylaminoimidazolecarboxamide formyltransferase/IMP cyclohydrolase
VLVVVSPTDYDTVLAQLDRPDGPSREFRFELARKAFAHTGAYDTAIASELDTVRYQDGKFLRGAMHGYPASITLGLHKRGDLRYGENPHQQAAWYADQSQVGLGGAQLLQGKELSYTNLLDLDAALRIVLEFGEPAAAFIKHTNPCGAAIGSRASDAYVRAREADPLSAFGAVVGLNRPIDIDTAKAIVSTKIDCVIAPVGRRRSAPRAGDEVADARRDRRPRAARATQGARYSLGARRRARAGRRPRGRGRHTVAIQ